MATVGHFPVFREIASCLAKARVENGTYKDAATVWPDSNPKINGANPAENAGQAATEAK